MDPILEALYEGDLPCGESLQPEDPAYQETLDRIAEIEEKLLALLPENSKELLKQMQEQQITLSVLCEKQAFAVGAKLGAALLEALKYRA